MSRTTPELAELLRQEAEHAEQMEAASPDTPMRDGTTITHRGQRSRVYGIRLSEAEVAALEAAAENAGIPASTLARTWITERLATDNGTTDLHALADALATMSKQLQALAR